MNIEDKGKLFARAAIKRITVSAIILEKMASKILSNHKLL